MQIASGEIGDAWEFNATTRIRLTAVVSKEDANVPLMLKAYWIDRHWKELYLTDFVPGLAADERNRIEEMNNCDVTDSYQCTLARLLHKSFLH